MANMLPAAVADWLLQQWIERELLPRLRPSRANYFVRFSPGANAVLGATRSINTNCFVKSHACRREVVRSSLSH